MLNSVYQTITNASAFQASVNYLTTFSPLEGTYLIVLNAQSTYQLMGHYLTNASACQASGNYLTTFSPLEGTYLSILNAQNTLTSYLTSSGASSIYQTIATMATYVTAGSLTAYQAIANMSTYVTTGSVTACQTIARMRNYITSGRVTAYQPVADMVTYMTSGSLTAYQTLAGLNKSSVGLGNVKNTAASSLPINATQTALDLKSNLASPIFTGAPQLTIGGLNYDLLTQPWVGGWFQFSSMTVQKQIGLRNFSVVRSSGYAAGSFDISFPAHPAGGSYMIIVFYTEVVKRCTCFAWTWWCYKLHRIYC